MTHVVVSDDVERSRRFYSEVLGGEVFRDGEPSFVALANSWIIIDGPFSRFVLSRPGPACPGRFAAG